MYIFSSVFSPSRETSVINIPTPGGERQNGKQKHRHRHTHTHTHTHTQRKDKMKQQIKISKVEKGTD